MARANGCSERRSTAASKRQQFMLGVLPACDGAYHRRLTTGERAGLVKGHRGDAARRFQPGAALDEQTVPGGADHAGDHSGRRGEHQRARARHTTSTVTAGSQSQTPVMR